MLHWDWPQVWSLEDRESIRVSLENAIRSAMAKGEGGLVRGTPHVDLPEIGPTPPQVMLSGIRELSLEHTAIMVKVRYDGEFSLTLRGLQVNVDTVGANTASSNAANLSMPFYCPLEMTISDIHIDGVASIEVFQEMADVGYTEAVHRTGSVPESSLGLSAAAASSSTSRVVDPTSLSSLNRIPRSGTVTPSAAISATASTAGRNSRAGGYPSFGYGVLLGAGGRRAMRPPEASPGSTPSPPAAPATLTSPRGSAAGSAGVAVAVGATGASDSTGKGSGGGSSGGGGRPGSASASHQRRHSLIDVASKRAVVVKRRIKMQLFGDPIKRYKVASNLVAVPGAGEKVQEHIQGMLNPIIERVMTDGINVELNP